MPDRELKMDEIVNQLSNLREKAAAFAARKDPAEAWKLDIAACTAAINTLFALSEAGARTPGEAQDLIYDYKALAQQYQTLHKRYEVAGNPILKDGVWHCPSCNRRTSVNHSYCHCCGKRLSWR